MKLVAPLVDSRDRVLRHDPIVVDWESTADFSRFDEVIMTTDTIASWTKSIVTDTSGGFTANRGRFAGNGTASQGGNSRIAYPLIGSESYDSEVTSLIANSSGAGSGNGQQGHCHRLYHNGSRQVAFMVWNDIVGGNRALLNIGVWKGETSPGGLNLTQVTDAVQANYWPKFDAVRSIHVHASWRVGSDTTYEVPYGHGLTTSDTITTTGMSTPLGTFGETAVAAVTDTTVTVASWGTGTDLAGGTGRMLPTTNPRPLPYWLKTQCVGTELRVKAWLLSEPEPSWSDSNRVYRWDDADVLDGTNGEGPPADQVGRSGIYAGHMTPTAKFVDYGPVTIRSLD